MIHPSFISENVTLEDIVPVPYFHFNDSTLTQNSLSHFIKLLDNIFR
ncbi:MAG: hypothetical protein JWN78_2212 [Bacteroidota bacterium]|nr:hypothetical protein [Bacteroidota bacterium]